MRPSSFMTFRQAGRCLGDPGGRNSLIAAHASWHVVVLLHLGDIVIHQKTATEEIDFVVLHKEVDALPKEHT